jgi:formylmethanofuran dehydrogenase subunit E
MPTLEELLQESAACHRHLCPRQVLGVRMGLLAGRWLGLDVPRQDKRLLTFVETDGCAADGVSAATGCRVGGRTLRVIDFGKVAATFVDVQTGCAVRIVPAPDSRSRAWDYAALDAKNKWQAQLTGYQSMPDDELLIARAVVLTVSLEKLLSKPGCRATCDVCGEEIINECEVRRDGMVLCRACAGDAYCQPVVETNYEFTGVRPL